MRWGSVLPRVEASFDDTDLGADMCPAEGEMLWTKDVDGLSHYSLCYAPSMKRGHIGPSGGHLHCDAGSYFMVEAPRFCCRKPRMYVNGQKFEASRKVCGDVLAQFDPDSQEFRLDRGPSTNASPEQLEAVRDSGFGSAMPSPLAFEAVNKGKDWSNVLHATCQGLLGTLVQWTHSDPPGKAEMCSPGTPPVKGEGYSSWSCDGGYTLENSFHCCTVAGRMHCASGFTDETQKEPCACMGIGGPKEEGEEEHAPPQPAAKEAAASVLLLPPCSALEASRPRRGHPQLRRRGRRRLPSLRLSASGRQFL